MKVLLIAPPRYYWPFVSEGNNFFLPQSLPYLASVLRKNGIMVRVIDCMPLKMGWQSLAKTISREKPDIVGVGENHTLYAREALKVLELAKTMFPKVVCIAGGTHFSNLIKDTLANNSVDFVVKGEGEYTFLELVKELHKLNSNFEKIKGIAYKQDDKIIETSPRPLIKDLNELPFPAYDLMPMDKYGSSRYLFSGGTTIHHSRGCTASCRFCAWWLQMAEVEIKDGKRILKPKWRTKSVENTIYEIEILYKKYNKRCLYFVDESWNIDSLWNDNFAEALLKKKFCLNWFAFMRIDCILRDEKQGIFEKLVRAGLSHICIGVERYENEELDRLGKKFYSNSQIKECLLILNKKYPDVFKQVTFLVGIRSETRDSIYRQINFARGLKTDYPAFHPITPVPGTSIWEEAVKNGWIEVKDFSKFDWMTPIISSKFLTREEIHDLIYEANRKFVNFKWLLRGLISRNIYKRNLYIWWLLVTIKLTIFSLFRFVNPFRKKIYTQMIKPNWYDS